MTKRIGLPLAAQPGLIVKKNKFETTITQITIGFATKSMIPDIEILVIWMYNFTCTGGREFVLRRVRCERIEQRL